jgi:hypothetical protein
MTPIVHLPLEDPTRVDSTQDGKQVSIAAIKDIHSILRRDNLLMNLNLLSLASKLPPQISKGRPFHGHLEDGIERDLLGSIGHQEPQRGMSPDLKRQPKRTDLGPACGSRYRSWPSSPEPGSGPRARRRTARASSQILWRTFSTGHGAPMQERSQSWAESLWCDRPAAPRTPETRLPPKAWLKTIPELGSYPDASNDTSNRRSQGRTGPT